MNRIPLQSSYSTFCLFLAAQCTALGIFIAEYDYLIFFNNRIEYYYWNNKNITKTNTITRISGSWKLICIHTLQWNYPHLPKVKTRYNHISIVSTSQPSGLIFSPWYSTQCSNSKSNELRCGYIKHYHLNFASFCSWVRCHVHSTLKGFIYSQVGIFLPSLDDQQNTQHEVLNIK